MSEQAGPIFREVQKFSSWIFVFLFSLLIFSIAIVTLAAKTVLAGGGSFPIFPLSVSAGVSRRF